MIDGHIIAGIAYSMVPLRVNLKAMRLSICQPDSRAQGVPCNDQSLKQTQFSNTSDTPCVRLSVALFSVRVRVDGGTSVKRYLRLHRKKFR